MPKSRIIAVAFMLVAIVGVAGYVAWDRYYRLPDPESADRAGVLRWIVLADLKSHSEETCQRLVDRFEELFGPATDASQTSGLKDLANGAEQLSPSQLARVRQNIEHLKQVWFYARVETYSVIDPNLHPAFMDRQIKNVFHWAAIDQQLEKSAGGNRDLGDALSSFFDALDGWKRDAPEELRPRINHAVKDGLIRWLATYDLEQQPLAVRQRIAIGLAAQLGDRLELTGITTGMPSHEAARFAKNVELLAQGWFYAKAGEYAVTTTSAQADFLKRQVPPVMQLAEGWKSIHLPSTSGTQLPTRAKSPSGSSSTSVTLLVNRWIAEAPAAQRPHVKSFADALQKLVIAQLFGGNIFAPSK